MLLLWKRILERILERDDVSRYHLGEPDCTNVPSIYLGSTDNLKRPVSLYFWYFDRILDHSISLLNLGEENA